MKRLGILTVAFYWVALGPAALGQEDPALKTLADRYWRSLLRYRPTWATSIGEYRYNARLDDYSYRARQRWGSSLRAVEKKVALLVAAKLSDGDRLTRDLLLRSVQDELLRLDCHQDLFPLEPLEGPHIQFPLIVVSHPFRNKDDFEDYVSRLRAFPEQVETLTRNMRNAMTRNIYSPRVTIDNVVPQLQIHIVNEVEQSALYAPVHRLQILDENDRDEVRQAIITAIKSDVIPAYRKLLRFVEFEYLPGCRDTVGLGAIPGGTRLYRQLARLHSTVELSPAEIHQIGLDEVARLRKELAKVQVELGFKGSLDAFLLHMRTEPEYRFESSEALLSAADRILQRTKPLMSKLFTRLPQAECVMKEIESFRAASSPVAFYNPVPQDGSRPGYFYLNTYSPIDRLRFTLEALTYHEAIPGHHLQMSLDQENMSLPKFRRHGSFTAYVEGWALYAEKLGYDIGGYRDANARFGQLTFEIWRACRLVVDTGIHVMRWSRDDAIDYMAKNTSLAPLDIGTEVDRYIAWPGQAVAYKIGELRFTALRKAAEAKFGDRFDLRAFHDRLLSDGAMPIDMLEKRMRSWIESN